MKKLKEEIMNDNLIKLVSKEGATVLIVVVLFFVFVAIGSSVFSTPFSRVDKPAQDTITMDTFEVTGARNFEIKAMEVQ